MKVIPRSITRRLWPKPSGTLQAWFDAKKEREIVSTLSQAKSKVTTKPCPTSIKIKDVLKELKKFGFVNADYKVILGKLKKAKNVDSQNKYCELAFLFAARSGKLPLVEKLIDLGVDVNAKGPCGLTALMFAADNGYLDMFNKLIEAKADLNAKTDNGGTALRFAAESGHLNIFKALVNSNDVSAQGYKELMHGLKNGEHILMPAIINGHLKLAERIIDLGIEDVNNNARTIFGRTSLMYAAENGHLGIVKKLIEANADLNVKDNFGNTALMLTAKNGHLDITNKLIEANADVNAKSQQGNTALMLAVENGHLNIVETLIKPKVNVNAQNKYGETALDFAVYKRRTDIFKALARPITDVKKDDWRIFMHAASHNDANMVQTLIKSGYDVDIKDTDGKTALMHAVENEGLRTIKTLIKAKADVSIKDNNERTVFDYADQNRRHPFMPELLNKLIEDEQPYSFW